MVIFSIYKNHPSVYFQDGFIYLDYLAGRNLLFYSLEDIRMFP